MTKETYNFRLKAYLLVFFPVFTISCNNGSETNDGKEESFFSEMFDSSSSADLEVTSEDIASRLQNYSEKLQKKQEITDFYSGRENTAAWNDGEVRTSFYNELEKAGEEGLDFSDYHGEELITLMENPAGLSAEEQATLEILLSDAFFEYGSHLLYGKLNPQHMNKHWGVKRKSKDLINVLKKALEDGDIESALADLKPNHQVYRDLKKALKEYEEIKSEPQVSITKIEKGGLIKPGEQDERINAIAQRLKELELLDSDYSSRNNIYDDTLQEAVKKFQAKKTLETDAVLGNSTIGELNMTPEDRYNQILANLERWRWYPRDLGQHYILINIPAFELAVVKDGDTVRQHNVIAGAKERPTPIFSDTVQYIVINPTWTIPPTIKSKDVIPAASRDPSYLSSKNISVFTSGGERLNPSSVDWSGEEVRNYSFVQQSGPSNPLGRVKIIYPNKYLIYLHDTPAKSLFNRTERAESSGCVRVENAINLSAYVVKEQEGWDLEKIKETIESGKTIQVEIKNPIQVHHFYWTTWRDMGETVFIEDIYNLDSKIYTALQEN